MENKILLCMDFFISLCIFTVGLRYNELLGDLKISLYRGISTVFDYLKANILHVYFLP